MTTAEANALIANMHLYKDDGDTTFNSSSATVVVDCQSSLVVDSLADGNDGNYCPGQNTLREAIANASPGNTITFDAGISGGTITLDGSHLSLTQTLSIKANVPITVSGNNASRVFRIESGAAITLTNLTIRDGAGVNNGGGIYSLGNLRLESSTIISNSVITSGGGIYLRQGSAVLSNTQVFSNLAPEDGGGIFVYDPGLTLYMIGGEIQNNTAQGNGGGIYLHEGDAVLTDTLVANNLASTHGGGFYFRRGNVRLTMAGGEIRSNTATSNGGGLYAYQGDTVLNDTLVISNSATSGSGLYIRSGNSDLTFNNGQLRHNIASSQGGGLYVASGSATLNSTQIISNSANSGGGLFINTGSATLTSASVLSNSANGKGGGLYLVSGSLALSNTSISAASANYGGGLYVASGSAILNTTSISGSALLNGASIYNQNGTITTTAALTLSGELYQAGVSFTTSDHNLELDGDLLLAGGNFYAPNTPHQFTLNGSFTLSGSLTHTAGSYHQTQTVNSTQDVNFPKAGGLIINANGQDLDSTAVTLTAGANCAGVTAGEAIQHCYVISPTNTSNRDASLTFFYQDSELPASHSCNSMEAYQWAGSWNNQLTRNTAYGVQGRQCGSNPQSLQAINVSTFPPYSFTLRGNFADLAISKMVTSTLSVSGEAAPGETITYTLAFTNNGVGAVGAVITDFLPAEITVLNVVSSGSVAITRTLSSQTAEVFETSAVSPGDGGLITITAQISSSFSTLPTSFTNTATITPSNNTILENTDTSNNRAAVGLTIPQFSLDNIASDGLTDIDFGSVAWGDYDNDGDLDILLTGDTGSSPGLSDTLSPMAFTAGISEGLRLLPALGNAQHSLTATLTISQVGTYYWSVQAIDTAFAGSPWAAEGTFEITEADLTIAKTVNPITVTPGDTITYTLTFSNAGGSTATGVVITDFIPAQITVLNVISSGDVAITRSLSSKTAEVLTFAIANATSAVSSGDGGVITITSILSSPLAAGTRFTNTALITTVSAESDTSNNTAKVGQTVSNEAPVVNTATFTITENAANGTYMGTITATDANGDSFTFSLIGGNNDGIFALSPTGQISVANNSNLDYETTPQYILTVAATDGALTGTANITVNINNLHSDLSLHKSVTPDTVAPNDTITYTLTFSNTGIDTATGVVITDQLPLGLTNISYQASSVSLTPTGSFSYVWQVEDLSSGQGGVITITSRVSSTDTVKAGVFTNTATITTTTSSDGDSSNNSSAAEATMQFVVSNKQPLNNSLNVTTTANVTTIFNAAVDSSTVSTSSLTVRGLQSGIYSGSYSFPAEDTARFNPANSFKAGEVVMVNASLQISSSSGMALIPYAWQFTVDARTGDGHGLTWSEHPATTNFDGAESVYAADVDGDGDMDVLGAARLADDIIWWKNSNSIGTSWSAHTVAGNFGGAESVYAADMDADGDMDVLGAAYYDGDLTVWLNEPPADVQISKSVDPTTAAPNNPITYTLTFSNAGNSSATNVVITDEIPAGLTNISYHSSGVSITPSGSISYVWQVEDLSPGEGGIITISGVLSNPSVGVFTNTATIATSYIETDTSDNTAQAGLMVTAADPTISKSVTPTTAQPGETITYSLTFANIGNLTAQGIVITDKIPISLTNISYQPSAITITPTGSLSYVWQVEDLSPGETGLITITSPVLITPTNGISVTDSRPTFDWQDATDDLSGVVSYTLHISNSASSIIVTTTQSNFTPSTDYRSLHLDCQSLRRSWQRQQLRQPPGHLHHFQIQRQHYLPARYFQRFHRLQHPHPARFGGG